MVLFYHDLKNKYLYYLLIGCLFLLPFTAFRLYVLFGCLAITYEILADKQTVWIPFLVYPLSLRKIVFQKILSAGLISYLIYALCCINAPYQTQLFMLTYTNLFFLIFLYSTYVVADGYLNANQINVLKVLGTFLMGTIIYYQYEWISLFIKVAYWSPFIMVVGILILVYISSKTMYKKMTHQIALSAFLNDLKIIRDINLSLIYQNRKEYEEIFFSRCQKYPFLKQIAILIPCCKQNGFYFIIFGFTLLMQVFILSLIAFILLVSHMVVSYFHCVHSLTVIGYIKKQKT